MPDTTKLVFFDMDGVLAEFDTEVYRMYGIEKPAEKRDHFFIETDVEKRWEVCEQGIEREGIEFWENLKPIYPMIDLFYECKQMEGIRPVILSSPGEWTYSYKGKLNWIKKHMDFVGDDWIFTRQKGFIADKGRILIDDWDKNIKNWNNFGGSGLIPDFIGYKTEFPTFSVEQIRRRIFSGC